MPSLTNCNLSTDNDYLICSTSDTGQNGKSVSSIALIYGVNYFGSVPMMFRCVGVEGGSGSGSGRVWMPSDPAIAKEKPPSK